MLLADERVDMRETIAFHLAMAGFPVVQAGSLDAVVDELHRGRPDVVVVADDLGGTPVEDLLVTITELDGVPVITLSEDPTSGRLAACLALGARDHVRRQAGAEELIARIDAVLRVDDELERLRQRNAELEFLAAIDPLTGMANRRGVEEELDRLVAGAIRHHLPLSAVMARVDGLDMATTTRRQRDAVLREVGYLVASARRTDDFAAVWDRRTFALLLPMTPLAGANAFAGRLHAVVGAAPVRYEHGAVPVTLSCAYAQVGPDAETVLPALETAVSLVQAAGGDAVTPV